MDFPGQGSETLAQTQSQESAEENIAPLPIRSQLLQRNTAGADDAEWLLFNLLSLDGGGIRGYWSLLALQALIGYIGDEEEKGGIYHSFHPQDWPENVYQAPLTEEEETATKAAYDSESKLRGLRRTRRYLPCHYFDHICGSSTGALIAIMLGRFRMTVPDCLFEYRRLGQEVFGKPRMISTLRFGLGVRHKYKAARLEEAFKDVAIRRNEQPGPSETGKITFPYGRGLCATFITTMKSEADGRSSRLYLIRSYDHDKQTSPDISRGPTPRVTMRSGRTNTDISANTNTTLRRQERKKSLVYINYEKAQQLEVWQVARAATAAKFYFEPLKIENFRVGGSTEFTDGGFGQANNPTRTGTQEIEELHGYDSIGIVVSIGTARKLKEDAKKATFFSTIPGSAREFADAATDPEIIHHNMQRHHDKRHEFPYYRLNHPGGLQTELDEWEPKRKMYNKKDGGAKTIADMEGAFDKWAGNQENIQQLRECAAALVARRRERMSTRKWERYAIGSHFECRVKGCDNGDFNYRDQFQSHLSERHGFEGDYLECQMRQRRKHWRYQVAPRH